MSKLLTPERARELAALSARERRARSAERRSGSLLTKADGLVRRAGSELEAAATQRGGVVRLDALTIPQRRLVLALVDAARQESATDAELPGAAS